MVAPLCTEKPNRAVSLEDDRRRYEEARVRYEPRRGYREDPTGCLLRDAHAVLGGEGGGTRSPFQISFLVTSEPMLCCHTS